MSDRILIIGGPKTGKTTMATQLAQTLQVKLRHTDALIADNIAWPEMSERVSRWLEAAGPWIIEGVALPRALRKWIAAHPSGKPCEVIYWLAKPVADRSLGQVTMSKAVQTVWKLVLPELLKRGVEVRNVESVTIAPP